MGGGGVGKLFTRTFSITRRKLKTEIQNETTNVCHSEKILIVCMSF